MNTSVVTPDEVHAEALENYQRAGLSRKSAQIMADEKRAQHRKAMLGRCEYATINAAHFMAACLASDHLPADAERVFAQDAIAAWLPHMPTGERLECIAKLRHCTPAQLGPDLVAIVASQFPEVKA